VDSKLDDASPKPAGLRLRLEQLAAPVDHEIVALVVAERQQYGVGRT
jgi:hypothetical protein